MILFLLVLPVIAAMYCLPLIVAVARKVPDVGSVAVINLLLGWTLIGWVVAMALAARSTTRLPPTYLPYPPGLPGAPPNTLGSPTMPSGAQAPPGWFPDPYRRARLRYFDGQAWTEHTSA